MSLDPDDAPAHAYWALVLAIPVAKRRALDAPFRLLGSLVRADLDALEGLYQPRPGRLGVPNKKQNYLVWGSITREKRTMSLEEAASIFGLKRSLLGEYVKRRGTYTRAGSGFFARGLEETAYCTRIRSTAESEVSEPPRAAPGTSSSDVDDGWPQTDPQHIKKSVRGEVAR